MCCCAGCARGQRPPLDTDKYANYLNNLKNFNTYLKGASYLLHSGNFSKIRNVILNGSNTIVQDDSGIALRSWLVSITVIRYSVE